MKQFFSYRGSLRRHDLCICNLIVLIANQIPLQKFGSLIGTQLMVSNIRPFSRIHSIRARCEESVLSGYRETRSQKSEDLKTKEHRNLIKNLSLTKHQS